MTPSAASLSPWILKRKSSPETALAQITFGKGLLYELRIASSGLRIQVLATKNDIRVFFSRGLESIPASDKKQISEQPTLIISTRDRTMGLAQGQRFFGFLDGNSAEYLLRRDPKTGAGAIALALPQDSLERLSPPNGDLSPSILEAESEIAILRESDVPAHALEEAIEEIASLQLAPLRLGFAKDGECKIEGPGFRLLTGDDLTRIYCYSAKSPTGTPWCAASLPSNQSSRVHLFGGALGKCASLLFGERQLVASNSRFVMETLL